MHLRRLARRLVRVDGQQETTAEGGVAKANSLELLSLSLFLIRSPPCLLLRPVRPPIITSALPKPEGSKATG